MARAKILACAVACMMVSAAADAQGNRGNSNGVPGRISNIQAIVDAVLAQISTLPDFAALQMQLNAIQLKLEAVEADVLDLKNASGGGAAAPIIWSGGCTTRGTSPPFPGYVLYCANGVDFDSMGARLTVDASGLFTVNVSGLYRVNYWGVGRTTTSHVRVATFSGVISDGTDTTGGGLYFRDLSADVSWTFHAGDTFAVQVSTEGGTGNFAYDAWTPFGSATPAQSRLQIEYVGPLPD